MTQLRSNATMPTGDRLPVTESVPAPKTGTGDEVAAAQFNESTHARLQYAPSDPAPAQVIVGQAAELEPAPRVQNAGPPQPAPTDPAVARVPSRAPRRPFAGGTRL